MLVMLLTLFSLFLTVALGGIFLVGLHRVVQWAVATLEARRAREVALEEPSLTSH
ncbi:hypothetical protein ACHAAC_11645 [Aeromicrobium sp. CF4.19]|uniref:hypothetical protein n=1 Tax=Aeromicrobium sp. CF4.19 TaxID=3373082 RepID=UPI003EE7E476